MKTSELIMELKKINTTVPFDAEVVTHGGIYPMPLAYVYHDPPDTFLEFKEPFDLVSGKNVISKVLDKYKNGEITKEDAISLIISD